MDNPRAMFWKDEEENENHRSGRARRRRYLINVQPRE
jgi:hypothetical protein